MIIILERVFRKKVTINRQIESPLQKTINIEDLLNSFFFFLAHFIKECGMLYRLDIHAILVIQ
jgi:hypothetical protein